ncbi:MAG: hypothetical protein E7679_04800 [Ruminococcaceae bacterium]|nr:hypothetical protein [Oscillospiraceae bacterium]
MDQEELYKRQEQSCKRYLELYGDDRIGINVRTKYGVLEPYLVYWAESVKPNNKIPYHIARQELDKLSDNNGCGTVYGRTQWGPYCKLICAFYKVISIRILEGQDSRECKRYMHEILEGGNSYV